MLSSSKSSKDKFVYLMDGYRDKDGKSKKRIIKSYGSLNKLLIKNPNILDELKLEAKQLTKQKKETKDYYHVFLDPNKETQSKSSPKNIGYFHLESIYDSLGITKLVNELQKTKTNSSYNLDSILKLLVFSRALNPASKQETINKQSNFFIDEGVNLHDTYRSLELLSEFKEEIEAQIHNQISKQYQRECSLVFYCKCQLKNVE